MIYELMVKPNIGVKQSVYFFLIFMLGKYPPSLNNIWIQHWK